MTRGIRLSETLKLTDHERVEKDGRTYLSLDWRDEKGTSWGDVYAADDLTLSCIWAEVIRNVNINFTIPKAGETLSAPTLADDIPCHIEVAYVVDEHFDDAETFEEGATYNLMFSVIADDETCLFETQEDEYGTPVYAGTVHINGEEVEAEYSEDEMPYLYINYEFTPGPAEEEPVTETSETQESETQEDTETKIPEEQPISPAPETTPAASIAYIVTEAPDEWIRGSRDGVKIVVKRNVDDSSCFSHFDVVKIDGRTLDTGDYTAKAGSTVLTLPAKTLSKRSTGEHTITILFDDGRAETAPTIREPSSANDTKNRKNTSVGTGDDSNITGWIILLAGSITVIEILLVAMKRRRRKQS